MAQDSTLRNRFRTGLAAARTKAAGYADQAARTLRGGGAPAAPGPTPAAAPGPAPAAAPPAADAPPRGRANPNYAGRTAPPDILSPNTGAAPGTPKPAPTALGRAGKVAKVGGAVVGVGLEGMNLSNVYADEGADAALAELPRSGGRLAGTAAGWKAGSSLPLPGRLGRFGGGVVGAGLGAVGGERAVDAVMDFGNRSGTPQAPVYDQVAPDGRKYRWGGNGAVPTMEYEPAAAAGAGAAPAQPTLTRPWNTGAAGEQGGGTPPPFLPAASATSNVPGDAYVQPQGGEPRRLYVSAADRAASAEAEAVQRDRLQPVVASANTAPNAYQTTRRTAGDIREATRDARSAMSADLLNPMGADAELVRRLENTQSSYFNKGSPQARRLAAQPYLEALAARRGVTSDGLEGQIGAYTDGARSETRADESFAGRRDEANMFNTEASERRRVGDRRDTLELMKMQQEAGAAQAAGDTAISDRYNAMRDTLYTDFLAKNGGDPVAALQQANEAMETQERREGLRGRDDSPYARAATLQESEQLENDFKRQQGAGFLWNRSLGRAITGTSAGDPQKRGGYTFDDRDFAPTTPDGYRQNMYGFVSGNTPWYNENTEETIWRRDSGRGHERAAAEGGDPRRVGGRRRDEDR